MELIIFVTKYGRLHLVDTILINQRNKSLVIFGNPVQKSNEICRPGQTTRFILFVRVLFRKTYKGALIVFCEKYAQVYSMSLMTKFFFSNSHPGLSQALRLEEGSVYSFAQVHFVVTEK